MDGGIEVPVLNVERKLAGNAGPSPEIGNIPKLTDSKPARDHGTSEAGGRCCAPGIGVILWSSVLVTLVWGFPLRWVALRPSLTVRLTRRGPRPFPDCSYGVFQSSPLPECFGGLH